MSYTLRLAHYNGLHRVGAPFSIPEDEDRYNPQSVVCSITSDGEQDPKKPKIKEYNSLYIIKFWFVNLKTIFFGGMLSVEVR